MHLMSASVAEAGQPSVAVSAVDFYPAGVCLSVSVPLSEGNRCMLTLEVVRGRRTQRLVLSALVDFCVQRHEEFRVGLNCDTSRIRGITIRE
jgi:hypothetical protein